MVFYGKLAVLLLFRTSCWTGHNQRKGTLLCYRVSKCDAMRQNNEAEQAFLPQTAEVSPISSSFGAETDERPAEQHLTRISISQIPMGRHSNLIQSIAIIPRAMIQLLCHNRMQDLMVQRSEKEITFSCQNN